MNIDEMREVLREIARDAAALKLKIAAGAIADVDVYQDAKSIEEKAKRGSLE